MTDSPTATLTSTEEKWTRKVDVAPTGERTVEATHERLDWYDVSNWPAFPAWPGLRIHPDSVGVTLTATATGGWSVERVFVYGRVLLASGKPGKKRTGTSPVYPPFPRADHEVGPSDVLGQRQNVVADVVRESLRTYPARIEAPAPATAPVE
jgi:hypothetical protein